MLVADGLDKSRFPQTKFFQACRIVFEGGGCRGAAHIGAFEAAVRSGVNVSEVAGTSAGSIVAALVGAGATPEYLLTTCAYLKFDELLSQPAGIIKTPWLARTAGLFFRGKRRTHGTILRFGAAYSSEKIQIWMDERLAELLPNAKRPIRFRDLLLPTWVVATDLARRHAKIWSTEQTPDESVALAVRCSSSIPLFFEPVQLGNDLYVDGGMLSNLPSFVFAKRKINPHALGGRVLALQLQATNTPSLERSICPLLDRLVDTAIGGATGVQQSLQNNVSIVAIDTGSVSSTNFHISKAEVETLLQSGREAIKQFIINEHSGLSDSIATDIARYGEDEFFDDLVREMSVVGSRLVVSCTDTKWFWSLFPSVAHWAFAGAAVDILIKQGKPSAREQHRRNLLKGMGARILETLDLPFAGFVLSRVDDNHNAAFILDSSESQYSPHGAVYVGSKHRPVIESLLTIFSQNLPPAPDHHIPSLSLARGDPGTVAALIKGGVNQYVSPGVSIEQRRIVLTTPDWRTDSDHSIKLVVRRIRSYKFRQIGHLASLYTRFNLAPFEIADVLADGRYVSTMIPPVLEEWGNDLVAVEGNTRLATLHRAGATTFTSLVVRGVSYPLPGEPAFPREVLLSTFDLDLGERIKGFNRDYFRSIEGAARPEH